MPPPESNRKRDRDRKTIDGIYETQSYKEWAAAIVRYHERLQKGLVDMHQHVPLPDGYHWVVRNDCGDMRPRAEVKEKY